MLVGPSGSGKSHLGAIWAPRRRARASSRRGARRRATAARARRRPQALLIEDADRIGADEAGAVPSPQSRARERRRRADHRARAARRLGAQERPISLSRLRLAPIVALGAPDLDLTRAVLFKLFSDRQLAVDPALVAYIALRIERSLGAARAIVAALDREALARGKTGDARDGGRLLRDE